MIEIITIFWKPDEQGKIELSLIIMQFSPKYSVWHCITWPWEWSIKCLLLGKNLFINVLPYMVI